jgi:hypothetical protein
MAEELPCFVVELMIGSAALMLKAAVAGFTSNITDFDLTIALAGSSAVLAGALSGNNST